MPKLTKLHLPLSVEQRLHRASVNGVGYWTGCSNMYVFDKKGRKLAEIQPDCVGLVKQLVERANTQALRERENTLR